MTIAHEFEYFKVSDLKEAFNLMNKFKSSYALLAGGTDLIAAIKENMLTPKAVIDIKGLNLNYISLNKDILKIGALTTYEEIMESEVIKNNFPLLAEAASKVASCGIRHRATMVGNICSAVPCLDAGAPLSAYEAKVILVSDNGEKEIPIDKWFVAPRKTSISHGEIVKEIQIKSLSKKHGTSYDKLSRYSGEDLAQAAIAVIAFEDKTYHISFASVGPRPIRATEIENILNGKELSNELLDKSKKLLETIISPISDIRASKEYRMHMSKVMLERNLKRAIEKIKG